MAPPSVVTRTYPNHQVTLRAWSVPEGVRFEATVDMLNGLTNASPQRLDNLRLFLDGEYAIDIYDILFSTPPRPRFGLHTIDSQQPPPSNTRQVLSGHVRLSLLRDQSRGLRTLSVSLFDAQSPNQAIGYLDVPVDLDADFASKVILRSMFNLPPSELQNEPGLQASLKQAGVNCLTAGVFMSPGDSTWMTTKASWEQNSVNGKLRGECDFCLENGFYLYGTGDDFIRTGDESNWLVGGSFTDRPLEDGPAIAVQRTAYVSQTYGGVLNRVDWVDEISVQPGSSPSQAKLISNWRLHGGPKGGWPMPETQSVYPTEWETLAWADYATRYPRAWLDWRTGREDGPTLGQYVAGVEQVRRDKADAGRRLPEGWELVVKLDCSGPFYDKGGPGGDYNPATDTLRGPGRRPEMIAASAWIGLAYGGTHFRMYGYDWQEWFFQRASAPVGTQQLQTGSRPATTHGPGDARWAGVSACYGSVAKYEKLLLASPATARRLGPWLVGENVALQWCVNLAERPVVCPGGKEGMLVTLATGGGGRKYDGTPVPAGGVVVREL